MTKPKQRTIHAVDLFAGAGGASTGLVRACRELGLKLDLLAINHWPVAVETHTLNHPGVRHLCEAVEQVDPRKAVPSGRLDILLAGPECTHFSTARGGRPVNAQSRASAWHILKWAQELYIHTIIIENVPEFRTWGPIGANHKPLKSKKGETYRAFLAALRSLGYRVDDRIMNAADWGDPTTRRRSFIFAQRQGREIPWPQPSHSKSGATDLFSEKPKWTTARDRVIDWSIKGHSIFKRKKPLRPATMARIIAGLEKFGGPELKPFLIVLRNNVSAMSIDEPVSTLTGAGTHHALIQPKVWGDEASETLIAMEHGGRSLDPDQPLPTITTAKGGAFRVAKACLVHTTHGGRANDVDKPAPTITGARRGELGVAEAFVLQQQSGGAPRSTDDPLPTVAAGGAISLVESELRPVEPGDGAFIVDAGFGAGEGKTARRGSGVYSPDEPLGVVPGSNRFAVAEPVLIPLYSEREGQEPRSHSVNEPVPTIPATGNGKFGVVEPFIVPQSRFADDERVDSVDDPLRTITAAGGRCFGLAEPSLIKYYGNESGAQSVDDPIDTLTAKDRHALIEPFLINAGGPVGQGRTANSIAEPLPTVLAENHRALVEPFVIKTSHAGANGTYVRSVEEPIGAVTGESEQAIVEPFISLQKSNSAPRSTDEPVPTLCGGEHVALVEPFVIPNNTNNVAQSVDDPLPTVTGANRLALVQPVINGMALDIHFRMLQPRELARAMSFPDDYHFVGTREAVVKQIGNAWAGELAKALCMAALQSIVKTKAPKKSKKEEAA